MESPVPSAAPPSHPRLRVLVVEDEPLLRWALAESLGGAGHTVISADDGASALRVLDASPAPTVDAILLDFRLPDSNDLGLLQQLRRLAPSSPVVLMTACNSPELTHDAEALGAFRVVDKPFEMEAIEACLLAACQTPPA